MRKITLTDKHQELLFAECSLGGNDIFFVDRVQGDIQSVEQRMLDIKGKVTEHSAKSYMYCWKENYG